MKNNFIKSIILVLLAFMVSNCKNKQDDNYKFLYNQLETLIQRDRNIIESEFFKNYYEIKNDSVKKVKFDSLYKISKNIDNNFMKLNFSNRKQVLNYRDSIIKIHNLPLIGISENDKFKLNDSVFKKKMEVDIISIRESFHYLKIYDRIDPL